MKKILIDRFEQEDAAFWQAWLFPLTTFNLIGAIREGIR